MEQLRPVHTVPKGEIMEDCKVCNLYDLSQTMAKELLESVTYPWEALPKINDFILIIT